MIRQHWRLWVCLVIYVAIAACIAWGAITHHP